MSGQHIFLSYSRKEFYFAESLALCLQAMGIPIWFDVQRLAPGSDWGQSIQDGLDSCSGLVLVASRASLASDYVRREWEAALAAHKPVYVLFYEAVRLPPALKTASIIDGRGNFKKKVALLAQTITARKTHRDRLPRPNPLHLPTRMPFRRFLMFFFVFLFLGIQVFAQTTVVLTSLQVFSLISSEDPAATPATSCAATVNLAIWLFFLGYACYYCLAILFRWRYDLARFDFFSCISTMLLVMEGSVYNGSRNLDTAEGVAKVEANEYDHDSQTLSPRI